MYVDVCGHDGMRLKTKDQKIPGELHNTHVHTWTTWPVPSKPASVNGVSVMVALWMFARAAALRRPCVCLEATRRTSGRPARKETKPIKHAT